MGSRQTAKELAGNLTEVVIQTFSDRILVLVTQLGKIGNLIQATLPPTTSLVAAPAIDPADPIAISLPPPPPAIQLTPLLGNAPSEHLQTLHNLFASQIATLVWAAEEESIIRPSRQSVIVGIALQKSDVNEGVGLSDTERATFLGVMDMVQRLLVQKL
ncbi:uncharacterized protein BT62DRAFT_946645 [Guyanagaster necrorhizus]|uniref:Proteasome assembly chaperone 3 n=1 Tax=Guyanagaster necrorhizus TaxID=856835 RepID=A0A9P8AVG6_9AGAR|nr:uncharacterized protein BT62DRAFT_946645 [Guyanagaster necrorhizus MCA 3950]KAG7447892.1 hypothetical protein BT62DRAFT_946645 [Guyanagaster necrorhizus MCA 3950]